MGIQSREVRTVQALAVAETVRAAEAICYKAMAVAAMATGAARLSKSVATVGVAADMGSQSARHNRNSHVPGRTGHTPSRHRRHRSQRRLQSGKC